MNSNLQMPIAKSKTTLRICVPVALSQIYMSYAAANADKDYSSASHKWLFEDNPDKIAGFRPDIVVSIGAQNMPICSHSVAQGTIRRAVVASPKLLYTSSVKRPSDLENLRYASLCKSDPCEFELEALSGDRLTVSPNAYVHTNNLFAARMAAQLGMAFAIVPKFLVQGSLHDGTLVSSLPLWRPLDLPVSVHISAQCQQPDNAQQLCKDLLKTLTTVPGIELVRKKLDKVARIYNTTN